MNQLKYTCFYPGEFSPPTKMHLNTLHWLLSKPEIGHVNVVIGSTGVNEITQEQKKSLWELLLKSSMAPQATIITSKSKGSISEIYDILLKKSDMPCFIALDEKSARNSKLQEKFDIFPNYGISLIPSQFKKSSSRVISALQDSNNERLKMELPEDFSEDMIQAYRDVLTKVNDPEAPQEMSKDIDYKKRYEAMFNDGFWNNVFLPIAKS